MQTTLHIDNQYSMRSFSIQANIYSSAKLTHAVLLDDMKERHVSTDFIVISYLTFSQLEV
jgi:hypothetical protein